MIIDFLGFGGTGKTTFINALQLQLRNRGIDVEIYSRPNIKKPLAMVSWISYLAFRPAIFNSALKLYRLIQKEGSDYTYLETLKRITLYSDRSKHISDKIVLSDEGLSVYLQHLKLENVDQNLKALLPEMLISLHVSERERLSRLYQRGGEVAKRTSFVDDSRFEILNLHYQIFRYHSANDESIFNHFENVNNHSFNPKLSTAELREFIQIQKPLSDDINLKIADLERAKHATHEHYLKVMKNNGVRTHRFDVSNLEKLDEAVKALVDDLLRDSNNVV